jgi:hypothetical protein
VDVANKHSTVNTLSLELQAKLRKRQYPFPKAGMHWPPRWGALEVFINTAVRFSMVILNLVVNGFFAHPCVAAFSCDVSDT